MVSNRFDVNAGTSGQGTRRSLRHGYANRNAAVCYGHTVGSVGYVDDAFKRAEPLHQRGEPHRGKGVVPPWPPARWGPRAKAARASRPIAAGQSVTLMDVEGPGVIRHIWMTVTDRTGPTGPDVLRNLILECYWDGEDVPVGGLPDRRLLLLRACTGLPGQFDSGDGQSQSRVQLLLGPCRFRHARIVLRNDHNEDVPAFFYQIDYTAYDELPQDMMRFHAQWRRERLTEPGRDYVVLDGVHGRGAICGHVSGADRVGKPLVGRGRGQDVHRRRRGVPHLVPAPAPRTTSAGRGASPHSTMRGICASRRTPGRIWGSRSIRSGLWGAKATIGMWRRR